VLTTDSKDQQRIRVKLIYSDRSIRILRFKNEKDMYWFIHNEGDHLMKYKVLDG